MSTLGKIFSILFGIGSACVVSSLLIAIAWSLGLRGGMMFAATVGISLAGLSIAVVLDDVTSA